MPVKKNYYFVVQSWMLEEMDLPLADAAVYAYIHGLTISEELGRTGWRGSKRQLARVLHTSPSTMNDIIRRLKEKAFVREYDGFIKALILRPLANSIEPKSADVRNSDTFEEEKASGEPF